MKTARPILIVATITLLPATGMEAQHISLERLPPESGLVSPSRHVHGMPGAMTVKPNVCPTLPIGDSRRRIVNLAVQEWAFFGFRVVDETVRQNRIGPRDAAEPIAAEARQGRRRLSPL